VPGEFTNLAVFFLADRESGTRTHRQKVGRHTRDLLHDQGKNRPEVPEGFMPGGPMRGVVSRANAPAFSRRPKGVEGRPHYLPV